MSDNIGALSGGALPPLRERFFALVGNDGFVEDVRSGPGPYHPFGKAADGKRVLDVTGVACAVGFVADDKGNVAPAPLDGKPLLGHEPAYHDRSNPPAPPIAATAAALSTSEPHPVTKAGAKQPDGRQDNNATNTRQDKTTAPQAGVDPAHPQAGLVQEAPVKSRTDPA